MTEFTPTELVTIALVMGQNKDEYDDMETKRMMSEIDRKARAMVNES